MPTTVFRFGLLPPLTHAETVGEQIRAAHTYQNKLIELERNRRTARDGVLLKVPDVATIISQITALESELATEREILQAARAEARSKDAGDPARAKAIVDQLRELQKRRKEAVKLALARPEVIEGMQAVALAHKEATKAARAACNVYWGTYTQVERSVEQAAKSPAPPRFQRWSGDGSVAVQLIATSGKKQKCQAIAGVLNGTNTFVRLDTTPKPVPGRGREGSRPLPRLLLRIGSEGHTPIFAEWPIVLHRPFPDSALVKFVKVVRRRIGSHDQWSVHFTLSHESETPTSAVAALAVNLRWSKTTFANEATTIAADWTSDTSAGEIHIDPAIVSQLKKADDLRSIRDKAFEQAKDSLTQLLKTVTLSDGIAEKIQGFTAWKSQGRLAAVVIWWRANRFAGDDTAFSTAEAWRRQDKHLWDWEANARRKALARRKDSYRVFAAKMARAHKVLIIEKLNIARLAEKPAAEDDDRDFNARSSAQRFATAPSELRSTLINAFRREGGTIVEVPAGLTSREMLATHKPGGGVQQQSVSAISARTQRLLKHKHSRTAETAPNG